MPKATNLGNRKSLRGRLYTVIGFLAVLPACAAFYALVALQNAAQDNAALDRAARGTIHLERINGLVYATVMESRGIYMSADWSAAEKFARYLLADLEELRKVAAAWRTEAIQSQQANVDELGRRIDAFVRFRTELVRLGKDEGTLVARAFGDNDPNRNVRTALNESLAALARAYEQEIDLARMRVEADSRSFVTVLSLLAMLGVVAFGGGLLMVRGTLLTPLMSLRDRVLRLAQGDLSPAPAGQQHAVEIGEMVRAIEICRADLTDRRRLNRETALLSALNQWLQSCNSVGELYDMVGAFLAKLLPDCAGELFIYANSRDVLESAKVWNGGTTAPTMTPADCWGLRRGRAYTFGESEIEFACAHVGHEHANIQPYCCIPILAHGDTIGLLHLQFKPGADGASLPAEVIVEERRLGMICAEQISLAIANVKLRDQLRDQSIRDVLTGLFNRRYLLETCRREFARAERAGQGVALLSIDVDHFKKYNDNHGHDAGDMVLRAVGTCLETVFRNEDVPCRFGGEEFVVLMVSAGAEVAAQRAEHVRQKVETLVVRYMEQNLPRISVSIGVACFPEAGSTPEAVLKAADEALYRAKAAGRNRVFVAGSANVIEVTPGGSEVLAVAAE